MSVVGGLDIHRKQITFDYLDVDSGQLWRGQIAPADQAHLAAWLRERFDPARHGLVELAVEACTGWRYVAEELARAGVVAHLGEPAETAALRGPSGAPRPTGLMLAICGSCWPLGGCRSVGSRRRMCWSAGRCWRPIMRCGWSTLPGSSGCTRCCFTRAPLGWVRGRFPPPGGRVQVACGLAMLGAVDAQLGILRHKLVDASRRLHGARVLHRQLYGVGPIGALAFTCWLGVPGGSPRRARRCGFAGWT